MNCSSQCLHLRSICSLLFQALARKKTGNTLSALNHWRNPLPIENCPPRFLFIYFSSTLQLFHSLGATWSHEITSVNHATINLILLKYSNRAEKNLILLISAFPSSSPEPTDHQSFLRHCKQKFKRPNLLFFLSCQVNAESLIEYLFFLYLISSKCLSSKKERYGIYIQHKLIPQENGLHQMSVSF